MSKINLPSRRRIAAAIRMVLRAETEENDAEAAEDLIGLLQQWETGTIHGRYPESLLHTHNQIDNPNTVYG